MQLELGNIVKSGQMREMWDIASRTDVRFNMVNSPPPSLPFNNSSSLSLEEKTEQLCAACKQKNSSSHANLWQ